MAGLALFAGLALAADPPSARISGGGLRASIYLPDAKSGYYRGTRFDWSGVVHSLTYEGHEYYGPWFDKTAANVHDFIYEGGEIIAGPCSAITGPVDEFRPLGWDAAKAGGTFVKIGIGALRKTDDAKYDNYHLYDIADPGKWTVRKTADSVAFTHDLKDESSGYGYLYRKTVRLAKDKPVMLLEHSLTNTGSRAIQTLVYNHNFLVLDKQAPGPGYTISVPFQIKTPRPPDGQLAAVHGNRVVYLKPLDGRDVVTFPLQGYGATAADHDIRFESTKAAAGMRIRADRPLARLSLWSIRTVVAMEPFIALDIEPGATFTWQSDYTYYTLPSR